MRLYFLLKRGHRWLILWTLSWISCEASWTLNNSKCFLYYPKVWDGEPWGPPFCYLQLSHLADTLSRASPKFVRKRPKCLPKASQRPPANVPEACCLPETSQIIQFYILRFATIHCSSHAWMPSHLRKRYFAFHFNIFVILTLILYRQISKTYLYFDVICQ